MKINTLKVWVWIHKWSSLICTIFMLLLCITGLPLIFSHEINHLLGKEVEPPTLPDNTPMANMDTLLANAKAIYPKRVVQYVFRDIEEDKTWTISLGKTATSEDDTKYVIMDARTAQVLQEPNFNEGFMHIMFRLHVDLFAGLPGMLFLGLMGVLLLIAIISGLVIYAPFMRRLAFGEIRRDKTPKLKRLDTHNFLGVVTLMWFLVVGATGVINAWGELLIKYWQSDQMSDMTAPYKGLPPAKTLSSLQTAVDVAKAREPAMNVGFIAFPGTNYSSSHHYGIFMRGDTPISARLFKPVLIDAQTSKLTDSRELPWYLTLLLVSQPLHFGDYAGMPLKILWMLLDIFTIVVLWSGLMLWWKKRNKPIQALKASMSLSSDVKLSNPIIDDEKQRHETNF